MKPMAFAFLAAVILAGCVGPPRRYLVPTQEPAFEAVPKEEATGVVFTAMSPQALDDYLKTRFGRRLKEYKAEFRRDGEAVIKSSGAYFRRVEFAILRHSSFYDEWPCAQSLWVWLSQEGEVAEVYIGCARCLV